MLIAIELVIVLVIIMIIISVIIIIITPGEDLRVVHAPHVADAVPEGGLQVNTMN